MSGDVKTQKFVLFPPITQVEFINFIESLGALHGFVECAAQTAAHPLKQGSGQNWTT